MKSVGPILNYYLEGCAVGISVHNLYGSRKGLVRTLEVGNEALGMVAGGTRYSW